MSEITLYCQIFHYTDLSDDFDDIFKMPTLPTAEEFVTVAFARQIYFEFAQNVRL